MLSSITKHVTPADRSFAAARLASNEDSERIVFSFGARPGVA
jgi:hypothetical protein